MNDFSKTRRTVLRGLALAAAGTCLPAAATANAASASAVPATTETYALTLTHLGRSGSACRDYLSHVIGLSGAAAGTTTTLQPEPEDGSGSVTVRVPRGRYLLDSTLPAYGTDGETYLGTDWIVQPRLEIDRDTTVVLDARTAAPVDVRPPEAGAEFVHGGAFVEVTHGGRTALVNVLNLTATLRVAHIGPAAEPGSVRQWVDTYWQGATDRYALGWTFTSDRALTGLVRRPAARELATLVVRAAAPGPDGGYGIVAFQPSAGPADALPLAFRVPGEVTLKVTPERGGYDVLYSAPAPEEVAANRYEVLGIGFTAGATVTHTFDAPVFGPALDPAPGARPPGLRSGDSLTLALALLADGDGNVPALPPYESASTTLHRNGALVGTRQGTPGHAEFTVPPARAAYRLTTTAARPGGRVTASWTFVSAATPRPTELPLSVIRFAPVLRTDGTAPARTVTRVPVTVHGAAARTGVRSLTVSVSTDQGATWTRVPVTGGRAAVPTPAAGGTVSLRAELTDTDGNTLTQTHLGAYRTSAA
ncbi:serine protease [Streptomyces sp. NPDC085481]|uniref:serine protease n=1 Tax=Streptomyces sp. NPDC085481 TaxID=3365727 RepID=UPI0037D4EF55